MGVGVCACAESRYRQEIQRSAVACHTTLLLFSCRPTAARGHFIIGITCYNVDSTVSGCGSLCEIVSILCDHFSQWDLDLLSISLLFGVHASV